MNKEKNGPRGVYIDDNYRSDRQTDILKVMMSRYLHIER
jgi:hypothetical protein